MPVNSHRAANDLPLPRLSFAGLFVVIRRLASRWQDPRRDDPVRAAICWSGGAIPFRHLVQAQNGHYSTLSHPGRSLQDPAAPCKFCRRASSSATTAVGALSRARYSVPPPASGRFELVRNEVALALSDAWRKNENTTRQNPLIPTRSYRAREDSVRRRFVFRRDIAPDREEPEPLH